MIIHHFVALMLCVLRNLVTITMTSPYISYRVAILGQAPMRVTPGWRCIDMLTGGSLGIIVLLKLCHTVNSNPIFVAIQQASAV